MINKKVNIAAKEYANNIYVSFKHNVLRRFVSETFVYAVNWFLSNLWHEASEEPKENCDIIIEYLNGTYTEYAAYRHNSAQLWSDFVEHSRITRWFYINEVLKKW